MDTALATIVVCLGVAYLLLLIRDDDDGPRAS